MKILQHMFVLVILGAVCLGNSAIGGGRNDGEPDYDPSFFEVRDAGRNDGEPDYDPGFSFELREGGRNDGEPDYNPGVSFELRDGGRNDGEPDYAPGELQLRSDDANDIMHVPDSVWQHEANQSGSTYDRRYLMLFPEDFKGPTHIAMRGGGVSDIVPVPDSVWEAEKNFTHPKLDERQTGTPPAQSCLTIKVIYNNAWVASAGGGNVADAHTKAYQVALMAQDIYNNKFAAANRLGTQITFQFVERLFYDGKGSWQATGSDLSKNDVLSHIDTTASSTQHYAFLTGADDSGALGIAYLGTTCLHLGGDQRYKTSISEWYNNVADTAGVLAHEIGHALGISHDFGNGGTSDIRYDSQGNVCTGLNGLMDYGPRSSVDKFSTCSREDFTAFYNRMIQIYGSFCLTCAPSCSGEQVDWRCCTTQNPCDVGGGDCDNDQECAGDLTCGNDNCKADFGYNWSTSADCCASAAPPTAAPTTAPPTSAPPSTTCGVKPAGIVGGSEATPYSLPWQVALVSSRGQQFCGGTLISDRHVLTAAHCTPFNGGNWDVVVGEHSISDTSDGIRHKKCRHVDHPQYSKSTTNNDYAIVHLQKPVVFGPRVVPACLPTSSMGGDFLSGKTVTVSGWGKTSGAGNDYQDKLRVVDVPAVSNTYCKSNWYGSSITDAMLCAGNKETTQGACNADSGGPLTYKNGGRATVVGVVSWGSRGCEGPTVFARVTEVLPWIQGEMAKTC